MRTELDWLKFRNNALEKVEEEVGVLREKLEQEKQHRDSDQMQMQQQFQQFETLLQGGLAHVWKQAGESMREAVVTERKKWEEFDQSTPRFEERENAELETVLISFVEATMREWKRELGRELENGLVQVKASAESELQRKGMFSTQEQQLQRVLEGHQTHLQVACLENCEPSCQ